ncbi:MAG: DNA replication/repair protein RecF [Kiloniellaceae bacterium]
MNEAILRQPRTQDCAAPASGASARPSLWLARLAVRNFRCYAHAEVSADARPVVLTGPNGAGKTNLLEAISFLAPGHGLRRARLGEVDRRAPAVPGAPAGPWAVAATVMTPEGPREIGTGREPAAEQDGAGRAPERRVVKIDGAFVRGQQSLGAIVRMVWLTPQMDGLFREGPAGRRRFLDRLVYGFDPAHAGRVSAYEQSLRERARLLKAGRGDDAWLGALEDSMARHGVAIAAARRNLVARLAEACTHRVGPFPVARPGLAGEVESWLDEMPALDAEERLRARLAGTRGRDAESGGAALGPHRSDLSVRHLASDLPAEVCSTGEQKALLLSIVLAHARLLALDHGGAPLLLLDEVAAHLDRARRLALYEEVLSLGAQAWLTGTDAAVFAPLGEAARFFRVADAAVRPAAPPRAATPAPA